MTTVDVQIVCDDPGVPVPVRITEWARAALEGHVEDAELTVRVVGEEEGAALNAGYRHREGATNVLSFPFEPLPGGGELALLGDVVICAPVVAREARDQGKDGQAHWAHMVVHGALHLAGYDHQDEREAVEMEAMERSVLRRLGFPNPYVAEPGG